eukprot:8904595-Heterocapsa_arctica.AAC.1
MRSASSRGNSRSWTRAPSEGGAVRRAACRAAPLAFRRLNLCQLHGSHPLLKKTRFEVEGGGRRPRGR